LPDSPLQAGFQGMWGTNDQPTSATFGGYTVQLRADSSMTGTQSSRGFFDKLSGFGGRIDSVDPSIRNFYTDFFFNRSTINGEGIDLRIGGLTPNQTYTLTLTSYDADATLNPAAYTPQVWGPKSASDSAGTSATINLLREPLPTSLWDPVHSGTIQVSTTTGVLDIFGTTTGPGTRGMVLNGFKLNDGASDVLLVDIGEGANTTVQSGFSNFSGPHFDADSPSDGGSQAFGAYTVSVERIGGNFGDSGFYNERAIRMGGEILPPATHNLFRDCFCSVSPNPGEGILLTVDGVTPNTEYDVRIYDMDPAASVSTVNNWSPVLSTTGDTANIDIVRTPVPQNLNSHYVTLRVQSTDSSLEIFGTTVSGFGGVRLNAIEVFAVSEGLPGDLDGNNVVDASDYVFWRKFNLPPEDYAEWVTNFGSQGGSGAGGESGIVPEPSSCMLTLMVLLVSSCVGSRRS
jgi:hypothetical protein